MSDLTELTALQKQMRWKENLAALGEMSAGIAHEFKNSLATISGYAQMIRGEAKPGEISESAERILDQTRALTHVVTEFLRFAKPLEIFYETVPMQTLVEKVAEELHETIPECTLQFEGTFQDLPGDEALLRQALLNLARNGAQAAKEAANSSARDYFRHHRSTSAAENGSVSASQTTALEYPPRICLRSFCRFTPPSPKAQAWASPWFKR